MAFAVIIAFVWGPMPAFGDVLHPCDIESESLEKISVPDATSEEAPAHEGHEQSTHHCGSCHVHIIGGVADDVAMRPHLPRQTLIFPKELRVSAEADGLYRPPRV